MCARLLELDTSFSMDTEVEIHSLAFLPKFPNLQTLKFAYTKLQDEHEYKHLASCADLRFVQCIGVSPHMASLFPEQPWTKDKPRLTLNLDGTPIDDAGFSAASRAIFGAVAFPDLVSPSARKLAKDAGNKNSDVQVVDLSNDDSD